MVPVAVGGAASGDAVRVGTPHPPLIYRGNPITPPPSEPAINSGASAVHSDRDGNRRALCPATINTARTCTDNRAAANRVCSQPLTHTTQPL